MEAVNVIHLQKHFRPFLYVLETSLYTNTRNKNGIEVAHRGNSRAIYEAAIPNCTIVSKILQENSAFVYDEYLPEEEERKVDYYDMLHQKIWNIPRNFLDLQPEVIGEGSFGSVFKGTVQKKGQVTPVAIYAIQGKKES